MNVQNCKYMKNSSINFIPLVAKLGHTDSILL